MLKYTLMFLCLGCVVGAAPLSPPAVKKPAKIYNAEEKIWLQNPMTQEQLLAAAAAITEEFQFGRKGEPISIGRGRFHASQFARWRNYDFIEYDTKIDRRWLGILEKYAIALTDARIKIMQLQAAKQTAKPEYKQWELYYDGNAKKFAELVKKPMLIADRAKLKELGIQKKEALEATFPDEYKKGNKGKSLGTMPKK